MVCDRFSANNTRSAIDGVRYFGGKLFTTLLLVVSVLVVEVRSLAELAVQKSLIAEFEDTLEDSHSWRMILRGTFTVFPSPTVMKFPGLMTKILPGLLCAGIGAAVTHAVRRSKEMAVERPSPISEDRIAEL